MVWQGLNCIFYNIQTMQQQFLPASDKAVRISSLALSHDRQLLVVAEVMENATPLILVYDVATFRRRKSMAMQMTTTARVRCDCGAEHRLGVYTPALLLRQPLPSHPH